jgi:glycosyltransferase involved in cell wall biosynthesis
MTPASGRSVGLRSESMPSRNAARPTIVYTTADASPQSGAFHSLVRLSREIVEWGYRPVLVLPEEALSFVSPDVDHAAIYTLPLARARRSTSPVVFKTYLERNLRSVYGLVRIIRKEDAALVHVNEILDLYGVAAARIARVPSVCHLRADLSAAPSLFQALWPRVIAALSNQIVAVSASARDRTFGSRGAKTEKVSVIHNPGPDTSSFHPLVDGRAVREEFGVTDDAFLVALVAKLGQRKGHEVLIRAAPEILGFFPKTHFLLVGGELDGPHHRAYADRLRGLPREVGVQHAVTFAGFRADIPEVMAAADLVTHCSTYPDPFPGVVLQSMAVGTPVIASDLGGPREQIEDQVSGILVPAGDPSALARAICSLLADPKRRASLGRAAAFRVRSVFTPDSFYQRLSEIYLPLVASHVPPHGAGP